MTYKPNIFSSYPGLVTLAMATLLLLASSAPVRAALVVSLSPLGNVAAGSTGNSFDVLLTNTAGPAVPIGAFFFEIQSSTTAVTLTDATNTTAKSYIFNSNSLFGPDLIGVSSTAQDLNASDLDAAGARSLSSGETVGLGHVLFNVSSSASSQVVTLSFVGFPGTSLSDSVGNNLPITTLTGGQFDIEAGMASAPEPAPALLLLLAVPLLRIKAIRRTLIPHRHQPKTL